VFAVLLYLVAYRGEVIDLPPITQLLPLVTLALAIGFFEAVFWCGWVLLWLVKSFGIGYAMDLSEMVFLFFIGIMFAVVFLITRSVLILWPVFQPMGQLITLIQDKLTLPFLAVLGFVDVLSVMVVLVYLAARYQRKRGAPRRVV